MKQTVVHLFYFGGSAFVIAAAGAWLFGLFGRAPFGVLFRMFKFNYHNAHPYQYIGIVALVYAMVATIAAAKFSRKRGWSRRASIFATIASTILIASVPGGILWMVHDMQAGWFPKGGAFWNAIFSGAGTGLETGWLVIVHSVPYNLIGLVAGYWVTEFGYRLGDQSRSAA